MEQTQSLICPHCQSEAAFSIAKLQASYGWMSCPSCSKVSHFEPKFGTQHRTVSFYLRNKGKPIERLPKTTPQSLDIAYSAGSVAQAPAAPNRRETRPTEWKNSVSADSFRTPGQPKPQRLGPRWGWIVAVGLLSLCIGVGAWGIATQRDWVAARWPQTIVWLKNFCGVFDCQIRPYQSLQEIDVQSSGLQLLRYGDNDYQLEFVLANRSKTMTVAIPVVYLVLLDLNNNALLRKKISREDFSDFPTTLAPLAQWATQTTIKLDLSAAKVDPKQMLFELSLAYE